MTNRSLGINPLPWILTPQGYRLEREVLEGAMSALSTSGFTAMTVEMPPEMHASEYGSMLAAGGFTPAPGYFSGSFQDSTTHDELVDQIRTHARAHVELGLDTAFIANDLLPERMASPAIGAGTIDLLAVSDGLARAAAAGLEEGITYGLHPHVGSAVETEAEIRTVLDNTQGDLFFGPDTGHLRWAGVVPEQLIRDYADRVVALHVKDVDLAAAAEALRLEDDYFAATMERHVWTEPGRGSIDFSAVFAALPDFSGWVIVEVDVPNLPSAAESSRASFRYLQQQAFLTGSDS